jgi:hypothetical protein
MVYRLSSNRIRTTLVMHIWAEFQYSVSTYMVANVFDQICIPTHACQNIPKARSQRIYTVPAYVLYIHKMAGSLASATSSRVDSASKHIVPCKVQSPHAMFAHIAIQYALLLTRIFR